MSLGLNDIFSCFGRDHSDDCHDHDDCKGKKDNNIFMLILIIAVVFCCSGSNGFFSGNACGTCEPCGPRKNNNLWIILVILFVCIFCKDGFQGVGGLLGGTPNGNLNTNIINLDREDYCDDYC